MASLLTLLRTISVSTRVVSRTGYSSTVLLRRTWYLKLKSPAAQLERGSLAVRRIYRESLGSSFLLPADREAHPRAWSAAANDDSSENERRVPGVCCALNKRSARSREKQSFGTANIQRQERQMCSFKLPGLPGKWSLCGGSAGVHFS
jgi:hypothetical protein